VLAGTCLGNDPLFAQPPRQQDLNEERM
jgi:hypothetical protein